jgi:hypothetical protein
MPSIYTQSLRFTLQATGDGFAVWGSVLNSGVFQLVDSAISGRTGFSLSGSRTLTSTNGAPDEARQIFLDITGGTGGTVTIPSVEKIYLVRNASSGDVVITTLGGTITATIATGNTLWVACDSSNVRLALATDFQGSTLTRVGTPSISTDGVNKAYSDANLAAAIAYADSLSFASGNLPGGQVNGYILRTDGVTPFWGTPAGTWTGPVTGNVTGNLTGNVAGNVMGNVSGSSGSCTGNAATATFAMTASTATTATTAGSATTATSATSATTATTATTANAGAAGFAINGLKAARVITGSATNTGRISWGTGAPGTLDEGEIFLRYA